MSVAIIEDRVERRALRGVQLESIVEKLLGGARIVAPRVPRPDAVGEAPEWWGVFHGWVRVGLAAAVLAAVLTGAALLRERERQERFAYEAVMESASVIPVAGPTIARGPGRSRDATLRSLISY